MQAVLCFAGKQSKQGTRGECRDACQASNIAGVAGRAYALIQDVQQGGLSAQTQKVADVRRQAQLTVYCQMCLEQQFHFGNEWMVAETTYFVYQAEVIAKCGVTSFDKKFKSGDIAGSCS